MSMTGIGGLYNNYAAQNVNDKAKKEARNASKKVESKTQNGEVKQPKLSAAAQKLLKKLQKTYGNMDFMVYEDGQDAKELLSHGTKEFSVLFSSEELEKMAADEKCEKEYMSKVQGAVRMSDEINKKFGFTSALEDKAGNTQISKFGIAFGSDGKLTLFAELEKKGEPAKKTTVEASSKEELMEKMNQIDWSKIKEEKEAVGGKFDYTI